MPPVGGMLVEEGKLDEVVNDGVVVVEDDGAGVDDVDEVDVLLVDVELLVEVELVELEEVDELLDVLPGGIDVVLVAVVVAGGNCVVEPEGNVVVDSAGKLVVVAGA